ncbi:MAG: efflux RND transporter periplasmic adaptor subunit [Bryobacteraceae bacterium]
MHSDNVETPHGAAPEGPNRRRAAARAARIALPLLAIVLLMLWVLGGFRRHRIEPGTLPQQVHGAEQPETEPVKALMLPALQEVTGTVRAEHQITVTSRVTANVLEIRAAAGRRIAVGEVLVLLDDRDLKQRVEQAQEALRGAEATLAQARADFERDRRLHEQQVIPTYDFEHSRTNLKLAEASLARLQHALEEAQVNLSYAVIRSPASGIVMDRLAEPGDLATPGKPLLTMYDESRLWVEASVPEHLLAGFRIGQARAVQIDAIGGIVAGRVAEIVPSADPLARAVTVRIRLERTAGIVPGMFGRLDVPVAQERVLAAPAEAILRAGQLAMVDVVEDGRLLRRTVQLGRRIGNWYEVLSGLAEGERVALRRQEHAGGAR